MSGKSGAHRHHAIIEPAPKNPERFFLTMRRYLQRWFRAGFAEVLTICLERNLTRRANQRHTGILARVFKPAPQNAAGFFNWNFPNRTAAARHGATPPKRTLPERRQRAAVRTNMTLSPSAVARERDGTRRGMRPCPHAAPHFEGYGFAPEMIAAPFDHAAHLTRHCEPTGRAFALR
jgi:hypothetical protein